MPSPPSLLIKGRGSVGKRGAKLLSKVSSPSPLKERETNGVRLINIVFSTIVDNHIVIGHNNL